MRITLVVSLIALSAMSASLRGVVASAHWPPVLAMLLAMLSGWALLISPQVIRQDFR